MRKAEQYIDSLSSHQRQQDRDNVEALKSKVQQLKQLQKQLLNVRAQNQSRQYLIQRNDEFLQSVSYQNSQIYNSTAEVESRKSIPLNNSQQTSNSGDLVFDGANGQAQQLLGKIELLKRDKAELKENINVISERIKLIQQIQKQKIK